MPLLNHTFNSSIDIRKGNSENRPLKSERNFQNSAEAFTAEDTASIGKQQNNINTLS